MMPSQGTKEARPARQGSRSAVRVVPSSAPVKVIHAAGTSTLAWAISLMVAFSIGTMGLSSLLLLVPFIIASAYQTKCLKQPLLEYNETESRNRPLPRAALHHQSSQSPSGWLSELIACGWTMSRRHLEQVLSGELERHFFASYGGDEKSLSFKLVELSLGAKPVHVDDVIFRHRDGATMRADLQVSGELDGKMVVHALCNRMVMPIDVSDFRFLLPVSAQVEFDPTPPFPGGSSLQLRCGDGAMSLHYDVTVGKYVNASDIPTVRPIIDEVIRNALSSSVIQVNARDLISEYEERPISDIRFIVTNAEDLGETPNDAVLEERLLALTPSDDYRIVLRDLNVGNGPAKVYLAYRSAADVGDAENMKSVTALGVIIPDEGEAAPQEWEAVTAVDNAKSTLKKSAKASSVSVPGPANTNHGSNAPEVNVFLKRGYGAPVIDVWVLYDEEEPPTGFLKVKTSLGDSLSADLNFGSDGPDVWLCYRTRGPSQTQIESQEEDNSTDDFLTHLAIRMDFEDITESQMKCVQRTPKGHDANLCPGHRGRMTELCYRKGGRIYPPIVDVLVYSPSESSKLPDGYICLEKNVAGTKSADLHCGENSNGPHFIAFKRGLPGPDAVKDIAVVREGEKIPHGFRLVRSMQRYVVEVSPPGTQPMLLCIRNERSEDRAKSTPVREIAMTTRTKEDAAETRNQTSSHKEKGMRKRNNDTSSQSSACAASSEDVSLSDGVTEKPRSSSDAIDTAMEVGHSSENAALVKKDQGVHPDAMELIGTSVAASSDNNPALSSSVPPLVAEAVASENMAADVIAVEDVNMSDIDECDRKSGASTREDQNTGTDIILMEEPVRAATTTNKVKCLDEENYSSSEEDVMSGSASELPITDIRIVYTNRPANIFKAKAQDRPESCPEGFDMVSLTVGGSSANLNADAGGRDIFICVRRSLDEPITGLAVINKGAGSETGPPPGYEIIPKDLNSGTKGDPIFLCFRKNSSDRPITDIAVLHRDRGETPKYGYQVISRTPSDIPANLNYNSKKRGREVYLCYSVKHR